MKKGLITAVLAVSLLAVSCGGSDKPTGKNFAFREAVEFYVDLGISGVKFANYHSDNKEAEMTWNTDDVEDSGMLEADVKGSSHDEMDKFATSMNAKGWNLTVDNNGDYFGWYGETSAAMAIEDWTLEGYPSAQNTYDCIRIFFAKEDQPAKEWPAEQISAFFEEYGEEEYEVPGLVAANATFEVTGATLDGVSVDGAMVVIVGATDAEIGAWVETTLPGANWVVDGDAASGYAEKEFEEMGIATIAWANQDGEFLIALWFGLDPLPTKEWPAEQISAFFEEYDEEEYEVPGLVAANATFEVTGATMTGFTVDGVMVTITGATDAEIEAWFNTTLTGAGWSVSPAATVASGMATKIFEEMGVATIQWQNGDGEFLIALWFGFSPIPASDFPHDAIADAFDQLGLPAFTLVEPDGDGYTYEYEFDPGNLDYVDYPNWCYDYMYINNMSESQFEAYREKMEAEGWTTDDDDGPYTYTKHFEEEGLTAQIVLKWVDSEDYGQYAAVTIYYVTTPDPGAVWPAEEISRMFSIYGADEYEVPGLVAEDAGYEVSVATTTGYTADGVMITVTNATNAEIEAWFNTALTDAGWSVSPAATVASGMATKIFEEQGVATIQWQENNGEFLIVFWFGFTPIPSNDFPHDAIADAFDQLGLPAFTLVEPDGDGYTYEYEFDPGNLDYVDYPNWCYDAMYINNMSESQFEAYREKMEAEGWTTDDDDGPYTYTKHFEEEGLTAQIILQWFDSEDYGQYAAIRIYYVATVDPSSEWPTEDVAALLGDDVTDVLPECQADGAGYEVYNDAYGMGVICYVGEDNVDGALDAYGNLLVSSGGFTFDESTGIFTSPNGQFCVELYVGIDGAFCIELSFPRLAGYLNEEVGAMLSSNGYDEVLPDFTSLEQYVYEASNEEDYCYSIILEGDHLDEVFDLLETYFIIPEEPTRYGYECILIANDGVEIDVSVVEEGGDTFTVLYVYAW